MMTSKIPIKSQNILLLVLITVFFQCIFDNSKTEKKREWKHVELGTTKISIDVPQNSVLTQQENDSNWNINFDPTHSFTTMIFSCLQADASPNYEPIEYFTTHINNTYDSSYRITQEDSSLHRYVVYRQIEANTNEPDYKGLIQFQVKSNVFYSLALETPKSFYEKNEEDVFYSFNSVTNNN